MVALGVHFALLFFLSSSRRSTENVFPGSANSCCSFARIASASAVGERWGREEGGGGRRVGREEERKQGVVGVGGGDNLGCSLMPSPHVPPGKQAVLF